MEKPALDEVDEETGLQPFPSKYEEKQAEAVRNGFIRKVYGILSMQLLLTIGISCWFMFHVPTRTFVEAHATALILGTFLPMIVLLVVLLCTRVKHVYPWNLVLLLLFTALQSVGIGCICGAYQQSGQGQYVLTAFSLTAAVFCALTLFALQSKIDFSFLGGALFAGLLLLIGWGLVNSIFGWQLSFLYSLFGAILFSLYILYDTSNLIHRIPPDQYILASISLYLDVMNLFLFILELVSGGDR